MATDLKKNQDSIKTSTWGGRRPGAGHPKSYIKGVKASIQEAKVVAVADVIDEFKAKLESRLLKNVDNLGQLADGYTIDQLATLGILPDRQANTYLIDRLLGKPVDPNTNKPPAQPVTNNTLILAGYSVADLEAMLTAMRRLQGQQEEA